MISGRLPKDRDFIETREGMLFCVVDYLHPPEKYTAYLKYSPAAAGRWQRRGTAYHRELAYYHAHQVGTTLDYLQEHFPEYVDYCPVRDMRFSLIPNERVSTYYYPEQSLGQVIAGARDRLEEEVARAASSVLSVTGMPPECLGVTGSVLLGIHDPGFSDIDLIVYGRPSVDLLRAALTAGAIPGVRPLDESFLGGWRGEITDHHGLTRPQIDWLVARRWNFVSYGPERRYLSFHPVRSDGEIQERYGDHYYRDAGVCCLQATVCDAHDAIYLPAVYGIEQVQILEGAQVPIDQIYCYEGLFGQAADAGQVIEARGKLEQIDGGPLHRLVVGSSHRYGREYLVPIDL